jgi:murein DD-endopeptidase MepM/ murein hydrolase activator NlpD
MKLLKRNCKFFLLSFLGLWSCSSSNKVPSETYQQFTIPIQAVRSNDYSSIEVVLKNILECPVRLMYNGETVATVGAKRDTLFQVPSYREIPMNFKINLGDPNQKIFKRPISLPFPEGKVYKVLQGYNGEFSHQSLYSKYSLDFDIKKGEMVCSADDGYVVGLVNDYKHSGATPEWKDKSNYLTIYHPETGLYTQYVHFKHQGALVKVGDQVKRGQPIAINGMTGFTTGEHLHFNVLVPDSYGSLISTLVEFEGGIKGESLRKGNTVKK